MLAVKPQVAPASVPAFRRFAGSAVFLSIMAGRTLAGLAELLGPEAAIVRAMPNTPAAVRRGMSVACAGQGVTRTQHELCETLLASVGRVAWVEDEALLDPVTAVSGSGPAYVFLLVELMERAAIAQGVPAALAATLARETVIGSGALLAAKPGVGRRTAPGRHQPRWHDRAGGLRADGRLGLAGACRGGGRSGDGPVARTRALTGGARAR